MYPEEFRRNMLGCPEPPGDSYPPLWDAWRRDLWERVTRGDDPFGFFGWPCVYHTMLQNHWPDVVISEWNEVLGSGAWDPELTVLPDGFYPRDYASGLGIGSLSLFHQFYHLWKFERVTGKRVDRMVDIVEFGGGYGAMALIARRLGISGRYYIHDLPEFSLLQRFFLYNCNAGGDTFWPKDIEPGPGHSLDLAIAGYSLSECDYDLRNRFLATWPANSYLFWYSNRFEHYDNIEYFQTAVPRMLPDKHWHHEHISHMPPESWYTIGWG